MEPLNTVATRTVSMIAASLVLMSCQPQSSPESIARDAFAGRDGALVVVDCSSGTTRTFGSEPATRRLSPCSTFKIWNALIGLESGILTSADEPFYRWDGETRAIPAWNRDLSLREAFQASCVPAFQALAREIGPERMQAGLGKLGYGDCDTSAGIDVFWLPARDRKTILISAAEQALLMQRLVTGKLPFSEASLTVLRELMTIKQADHGALFAKTGSGTDDKGAFNLGWFVGYVESHGRTYAFACTVQGETLMSKDARAVVETFFTKQGLL